MIGTVDYRAANLKNLYVKDCDIIVDTVTKKDKTTVTGNLGGIVGFANQNINGYNLKIDGVTFKNRAADSETITDNPSDAGIIVGKNNDNNKIDKFIPESVRLIA
jgi:hypothetical protein